MTGDKRGFTLMEMLVALALFSVVVTIATDLFLTFQRTSRKTENLEKLVSTARSIVEQIAREVRQGTPDYNWYREQSIALAANPRQTALALEDRDNQAVRFSFDESLGVLNIVRSGGEERLNSAGVIVRQAHFLISPTDNPFEFISDRSRPQAGQFGNDLQPRVTIFLSLSTAADEGQRDYVEYDLQTTISSRVYRR